MALDAGSAIAYLTLDHSGYSSGLKSAALELKTFMNNSESASTRMDALGSAMTNVGTVATKGLTLPIVGAGAAATKFSIDYESALTGVAKTTDLTASELENLSQGIRNMAKEMPESATQIASVAEAAGQLGIKKENLESFTKTMVMLGDSTNMSSNEAATSLARLANITGMSQENFDRLGSCIVDCGNNFATTEQEITEMSLRLAGTGKQVGLTEAQIVGFSTALSSVGIEAEMGGNSFSKAFAMMNSAVAKGGDSLKQFADVAGMTSEQFTTAFKQDAAGAMVSFLQGLGNCTAQGKDAMLVLDQMGISEIRMRDTLLRASSASNVFSDALKVSNNAWNENNALTNEAEKRYATTESKLKILKNKLIDVGISIGDKILPYVTKAVDAFGNWLEKFNGLSDGQQKFIIKTAAIVAAIGPLLIIGGKAITMFTKFSSVIKTVGGFVKGSGGLIATVGKLGTAFGPLAIGVGAAAGAMYLYHQKTKLANSTCLDTKDKMSLVERAMAKMTDTTVYSKRELQNLGLVYEDFGNNVSKNFKEKVEESTDAINEFALYLGEINIDGVLSEDEISEFDKRINSMCDSAISTIQGRKEEVNKQFSELFADDGSITETENKVLEILNASFDAQISEEQKLKEEIMAIKQKAVEEKRALNEQEIKDIEEKNARIKQIELEAVGGTEEEILYAKKEFNARVASIDLEDASKLMKEKAKIRDDELVQISAKYDSAIEILKQKSKEATGEDKKALEEQIRNLEDAKQQKINSQNNLYDEYLRILAEKNPEIAKYINEFNGQILTQEDLQTQAMLEECKSRFEGLNSITKTGMYNIYDSENQQYVQMAVMVDEHTKKVTGCYSTEAGVCAGYCQEMEDDVAELAGKYYEETEKIKAALNDGSNTTVTASNKIKDANGNIVASLQDVKNNADGTRTGILNLNGTPIKVIVDKDDTIKNIDAINDKLNNTAKDRYVKIHVSEDYNPIKDGYWQDWRTAPGTKVSGYATGTYSAMEGWRLVGENGPELMKFKGGEQVVNAVQTQKILNEQTNADNQQVVNNFTIDYEKLGDIVADKVDKVIDKMAQKLKDAGIDRPVINKSDMLDVVSIGLMNGGTR